MAWLAGCTPEKAKALQAAATQFRVEAFKALNAIDAMRQREVSPPPRSDQAAAREFATALLQTKKKLEKPDQPFRPTSAIIQKAVHPHKVRINPETEAAWDEFFGEVRAQYAAFSSIFDRLQAGSYAAGKAVRKAKPIAEKLTLQMAAMAKSISDNPPRLLIDRAIARKHVRDILDDKSLSPNEQKSRLEDAYQDFVQIEQEEGNLQQEAVGACVATAALGKEVIHLIETYEQLSIDEIQALVSQALGFVGVVSGQDLSQLKGHIENLFAEINSDPDLKTALDELLADLNTARAGGAD